MHLVLFNRFEQSLTIHTEGLACSDLDHSSSVLVFEFDISLRF